MNHPDLDTWAADVGGNDGEEDGRAAADEYRWLVDHEKACARSLPVRIETWLGTLHTVLVCPECSHVYAFGDPYPPAVDTSDESDDPGLDLPF